MRSIVGLCVLHQLIAKMDRVTALHILQFEEKNACMGLAVGNVVMMQGSL